MNIIRYWFGILALVGMFSQSAIAQGLSSSDLSFAFGSNLKTEFDALGNKDSDVIFLTEQEMLTTEGEVVHIFSMVINGVRLWFRIGGSFSRAGRCATFSVCWGSNSAWRQNIRNSNLRNLNELLRNYRIPINSWRTRDPGHFHLWRR